MIYFDQAATSFPKPKVVLEAMTDYFNNAGGNVGRSAHRQALAASETVYDTRDLLARLFNIKDSGRIVFTKNVTESLNVAINGFWEKGCRVLTTSAEHNSVMRPLRYLEQQGWLELSIIPADSGGIPDLSGLEDLLKQNSYRLAVINHASNVTGALAPVELATALCHKYGCKVLVDAAQTAGAYPIDVASSGIDLLAFTGHKSLLGPQGTGGLYVDKEISLLPLIRGGTGSNSENEVQPDFFPDLLEAGTLNIIGLAGLGAGVKYILDTGIGEIREAEMKLTEIFLRGLAANTKVEVYGAAALDKRVAVVSFNIAGRSPSEVAYLLDRDYNIACRSGLHCAPSAHKTLGTLPRGTVRFSFGFLNNEQEVEQGIEAINQLSV